MNHKRWFLLTLLVLLTACNDESQTPELDIAGHWNIDHGLYDSCQINATFTEQLLVLTFFSLEEGACQPERYGIQNNALVIRIDDKQDYFEEDGTLATTLQVSVPEHQAVGTLSLRETDEGLAGDIVTASDPNNLLEPLLEPLYKLTPISDHWLPLALGRWGVSCDQWGFPDTPAGQQCELIEINSATSGRIKSYGGTSSIGPNGEVREIQSEWHEVTFALRDLVARSDDTYELELVMLGGPTTIDSIPMTWNLSENYFTLTATEGGGTPSEFQLLPAD